MTKARVNADNASADIQGVTAGTGLTGGGTSGTVTLDVDTTTIQARVANVTDTEIGYLDGVSSAIQTQLNGKINNTLTTTTGDIIYASGANTPARLGIGSSGNVLTVSGGVPTWAAPAGGSESWSLLNTGGTALSGSATVTVSGISGKSRILVVVKEAGTGVTSEPQIQLRINADASSLYSQWGATFVKSATYASSSSYGDWAPNNPSFVLGHQNNNAAGKVSSSILLSNCNSTSYKIAQIMGGAEGSGDTGTLQFWQGFYEGTSTVSSISVRCTVGTFDEGRIYVYAA